MDDNERPLKNHIACSVMLYNRPEYTEQVLESLANNDLAEYVTWTLFIDGPRDEKDAKAVERVKEIAMAFPCQHTTVLCENSNMGVPYQKSKAHKLFDMGFEHVIFFEDDMIVSPYYLSLIVHMQNRFPNDLVYAPARPIRNGRHPVPSDAHLHHVAELSEHLWGYSITAETYRKIKHEYDQYVEFFTANNIDYRRRPHELIMRTFDVPKSSHDAVLDHLFAKYSVRKVGTVIPRAKYIGRVGIHQNPEAFDLQGYSWLEWYSGFVDRSIDQFIFYKGEPVGPHIGYSTGDSYANHLV